jgi:hypothetical protein
MCWQGAWGEAGEGQQRCPQKRTALLEASAHAHGPVLPSAQHQPLINTTAPSPHLPIGRVGDVQLQLLEALHLALRPAG